MVLTIESSLSQILSQSQQAKARPFSPSFFILSFTQHKHGDGHCSRHEGIQKVE